MKKTFAAIVLLLGSLLPSLQADVVIYRGTGHGKTDLATLEDQPTTVNFYVVVDYSTGEARTVTYFAKNGRKTRTSVAPITLSIGEGALPKGKSFTTLTGSETAVTSPTQFAHAAFQLQGSDATLTIQKQPSVELLNRPKLLKLTTLLSTRTRFQTVVGSVSFQAALTQEVNKAGQDLDGAMGVVVDLLTEKKFFLPM